MPKLTKLPSLDIIHGFRGVLDFYVYKGQVRCRKWPYLPKSHQTPATRAAAVTFGAILKNYHFLAGPLIDAFTAAAKDQPRTPRDLYMAATLGTLHEANMSDIQALIQECVDALQLIDNLINALESIDTDRLQVNVMESALPTGAATNAKLDEVIAAMTTGQILDIPFIIGDSVDAITTGQKGHIPIDFPCTIQACKMYADQQGSIVIDIWKDTHTNFPPTVADSITAAAKPTITTAQKSEDTTLTGWTKDIDQGDILAFNVDSCTDIARVTLSLKVARR